MKIGLTPTTQHNPIPLHESRPYGNVVSLSQHFKHLHHCLNARLLANTSCEITVGSQIESSRNCTVDDRKSSTKFKLQND